MRCDDFIRTIVKAKNLRKIIDSVCHLSQLDRLQLGEIIIDNIDMSSVFEGVSF